MAEAIKNPKLLPYHNEAPDIMEVGIDEAGRGPLFGRVYTAAVVLPKDNSFDHSKMKDSKKFHSKQKITEVSEYIKQNALFWSITFADEKTIDDINILQATQQAMHQAVSNIRAQSIDLPLSNYLLLVDGNYFKAYMRMNLDKGMLEQVQHLCIEGGDNKYSAIAAASILAKVARDDYIDELCCNNPLLSSYYGLDTNKGYGTKKHMDGIKTYGITEWHRRSFAPCKDYC